MVPSLGLAPRFQPSQGRVLSIWTMTRKEGLRQNGGHSKKNNYNPAYHGCSIYHTRRSGNGVVTHHEMVRREGVAPSLGGSQSPVLKLCYTTSPDEMELAVGAAPTSSALQGRQDC